MQAVRVTSLKKVTIQQEADHHVRNQLQAKSLQLAGHLVANQMLVGSLLKVEHQVLNQLQVKNLEAGQKFSLKEKLRPLVDQVQGNQEHLENQPQHQEAGQD